MTLKHVIASWEYDLPLEEKFVLCALAYLMGDSFDFMDIAPHVSQITGISPDGVRIVMQKLMHKGVIVRYGVGDMECTIHIPVKEEPPQQPPPEPKKASGYVYLLRSETGVYKIGKASQVESRIKMLHITLPFEVELVCAIASDEPLKLEKQLHQKFATKHVKGEWFSLSPEDVEYIKGLAE